MCILGSPAALNLQKIVSRFLTKKKKKIQSLAEMLTAPTLALQCVCMLVHVGVHVQHTAGLKYFVFRDLEVPFQSGSNVQIGALIKCFSDGLL